MADQGSSNAVHPFIYKAVAVLVFWTGLAAWGFFADHGRTPFILADVTAFCAVAVAIPYALLLIWRKNRDQPHRLQEDDYSFRDWTRQEIDTWGDHLRNSEATILILLPLVAVALGLTLFAVIKNLAT